MLISEVIEDSSVEEEIPLSVSYNLLNKSMDFCRYFINNPSPNIDKILANNSGDDIST